MPFNKKQVELLSLAFTNSFHPIVMIIHGHEPIKGSERIQSSVKFNSSKENKILQLPMSLGRF